MLSFAVNTYLVAVSKTVDISVKRHNAVVVMRLSTSRSKSVIAVEQPLVKWVSLIWFYGLQYQVLASAFQRARFFFEKPHFPVVYLDNSIFCL
jgi:hypothetical protein